LEGPQAASDMVDMYSVVCVFAEMQDMFKDKRVKKRVSGVEVKKSECSIGCGTCHLQVDSAFVVQA
jgi:hypothetical protein